MASRSPDLPESSPAAHRAHRAIRLAVWAFTLLVLAGVNLALHVATAAGDTVESSRADHISPAGAAVTALVGTDHARALQLLPPDFEAVMGYRPQPDDGYPIDPDGSCSSPVTLPSIFEPLCKTHDFGYDLLRYADRTGAPLGAWARLALDRMLVERMSAACSDEACSAAAEATRVGLAVNTWRQSGGAPTAGESLPSIALSTARRAITAFRGGRWVR